MLKKSVSADVRPLKPKMHWIADAILFTSFVMSFFLNLTGLALRQWLGIGIGGLALYHLIVHWKWVETVTQRFLKCNWRMRVYYRWMSGLVWAWEALSSPVSSFQVGWICRCPIIRCGVTFTFSVRC